MACIVAGMVLAATVEARAQDRAHAYFTDTLSNNVPLAFGMTSDDVARALNRPLYYVSGRPGHERLMALRDVGGSGLQPRADRLYLQFRNGRLTGWKGDWGQSWMWR
jgi:hypothetical protein